jgi:hypothetical protein
MTVWDSPIIGIDFDNTLISYDELLYQEALRQGLIAADTQHCKKVIRDSVRRQAEGEVKWQYLQAAVYGPKIGQAVLFDGVPSFFAACRQRLVQTHIVSHKTRYAHRSPQGPNLRESALAWMNDRGFFKPQGMALDYHQVFFESTRAEKIRRLDQLGCTHFIDDLEETFNDVGFPAHIIKIWFAPQFQGATHSDWIVMKSWKEIYDYFFSV